MNSGFSMPFFVYVRIYAGVAWCAALHRYKVFSGCLGICLSAQALMPPERACVPEAHVIMNACERAGIPCALQQALELSDTNADKYARVLQALQAGQDPNQWVSDVRIGGKTFRWATPLYLATTPALADLLVAYGAQPTMCACVDEYDLWTLAHVVAMSDEHEPALIPWCVQQGVVLAATNGRHHTPAELLAQRLRYMEPEIVRSVLGCCAVRDRATDRVLEKLSLLKKYGSTSDDTLQSLAVWHTNMGGYYCADHIPGRVAGSSCERECASICSCCAGCSLCVAGCLAVCGAVQSGAEQDEALVAAQYCAQAGGLCALCAGCAALCATKEVRWPRLQALTAVPQEMHYAVASPYEIATSPGYPPPVYQESGASV